MDLEADRAGPPGGRRPLLPGPERMAASPRRPGIARRAGILLAVLAAAAGGLGVARLPYPAGSENPAAGVSEDRSPGSDILVTTQAAGRLDRLLVRDGDAVHRGQVVAVVEVAGGPAEPPERLEGALNTLRAAGEREEVRRAREVYDAALRRLRQARAERDVLRAGTRPEFIRRHEAWLRQAEAGLALVRAGPREEQIRRYRAAAAQAETRLELLREGTRPEQIRQAEAALEQVLARQALLKAGARPQEIEQLNAGVRQAKITLGNADSELRRAQQLIARGLISGQQVEQARTQRDLARSQLQAAEERLAEARAGARPEELREMEAQAEAARHRVGELRAGARRQELRDAELAVESARQQLAEALAGPRPEEVSQAQAIVDAASAQLAAVRAGPTAEELRGADAAVETAEAEVRSAQAGLELAGTVAQAEAMAPAAGDKTRPAALPAPGPDPGGHIEIRAPADGTVSRCAARAGDMLAAGAVIVRLAPRN